MGGGGRRVGRAPDSSYVLFEGLLSARQLASAREYVGSAAVQSALDEGILFNEKSSEEEEEENKAPNNRQSVGSKRKRSASQRLSRIAWLEREEDESSPKVPEWLHARMRHAAKLTHAALGEKLCPVGVDVSGRWTPRYEPLQYTEYGPGAHYASWHTDSEPNSDDPEDARAVTVVLLLSDPEAYTGGKFQVRSKTMRATEVKLRAGDAIGFPSQLLEHRVTKCHSGLRQTIVCWATRPYGLE